MAGIDEVGRGAWAGPVVAAAVVMPYGRQLDGLADSKQLTVLERRRLGVVIRREALAIGLGWVSAADIDRFGLSWAVRQASRRALDELGLSPDKIILDGKHNFLASEGRSFALVGADALVTPVAAASVVAKVARDGYIEQLERRYPGYGFSRHKGYGTELHRRSLSELGISQIHRHSYRPVRELG